MNCKKWIYATRGEAKAMKKAFNLGNRTAKKITDVYYCNECQGYHLTSMNKKRSRDLTRKQR